jgi:hypothetical protein
MVDIYIHFHSDLLVPLEPIRLESSQLSYPGTRLLQRENLGQTPPVHHLKSRGREFVELVVGICIDSSRDQCSVTVQDSRVVGAYQAAMVGRLDDIRNWRNISSVRRISRSGARSKMTGRGASGSEKALQRRAITACCLTSSLAIDSAGSSSMEYRLRSSFLFPRKDSPEREIRYRR